MPFLKKLDLGFNQLEELPEIPHGIEALCLDHNSLRSLPMALTKLTNLQKLDLGYNKLKEVDSLAQIESLEILILCNNEVYANHTWNFSIPRSITAKSFSFLTDYTKST